MLTNTLLKTVSKPGNLTLTLTSTEESLPLVTTKKAKSFSTTKESDMFPTTTLKLCNKPYYNNL